MEQISCHICGRTKESLGKKEIIISLEYQEGRKAYLCSICNGLIENIVESTIQSHLYYDLDSHQELSDFIKKIVESYLYQKPEERF